MLILSQLFLALHFFIQFNTGWRHSDPDKAIMLNMILFPLSGLLMLFSLLFMFTKGAINNKVVFWCAWTYFVCLAVLLYSYTNPTILYPIECIGSVAYTILFTVVGLYVRQQFKDVRVRMDNYFSHDTTSHTDWMATSIAFMIGLVLCVPFAILSNNGFLKCVTLLNFVTIFFYVNRFIYYGYDIQMMIERYFEIVEADTIRDDFELNEADCTQTSQGIETAIAHWIEKKCFTEPELTIDDVVKQTGFRRASLTNYINNILGLSFRAWLNSLRITEAKQILRENPDYSHETVADLAGFSSRTYFLKVFKDKEGMPPGDWLETQLK